MAIALSYIYLYSDNSRLQMHFHVAEYPVYLLHSLWKGSYNHTIKKTSYQANPNSFLC